MEPKVWNGKDWMTEHMIHMQHTCSWNVCTFKGSLIRGVMALCHSIMQCFLMESLNNNSYRFGGIL